MNYSAIQTLITEMSNFVERNGSEQILFPVDSKPVHIHSRVQVPQVIKGHLLIGDVEKHLIPKKFTDYFYVVLQRIEEIPF